MYLYSFGIEKKQMKGKQNNLQYKDSQIMNVISLLRYKIELRARP